MILVKAFDMKVIWMFIKAYAKNFTQSSTLKRHQQVRLVIGRTIAIDL